MKKVKCYAKILPVFQYDANREEEIKKLQKEKSFSKIYDEKTSNLKIYNDLIKKRITKKSKGISKLIVFVDKEECDSNHLLLGDDISLGILNYVVSDLVYAREDKRQYVVQFRFFNIINNSVTDLLKNFMSVKNGMINVNEYLELVPKPVPHSDMKKKREKEKKKKESSLNSSAILRLLDKPEKHDHRRIAKKKIPTRSNKKCIHLPPDENVDLFTEEKKKERFVERCVIHDDTIFNERCVNSVYLNENNAKHILEILMRRKLKLEKKKCKNKTKTVTYTIWEFLIQSMKREDGGNAKQNAKRHVKENHFIIMCVSNVNNVSTFENSSLKYFLEFFLTVKNNIRMCRKIPFLGEKKNVIIKYMKRLIKENNLSEHRRDKNVTNLNRGIPFELNFLFACSDICHCPDVNDVLYTFLRKIKSCTKYEVYPFVLNYNQSAFSQIEEKIYMFKSLLNQYNTIKIRNKAEEDRCLYIKYYIKILRSSIFYKGNDCKTAEFSVENNINHIFNVYDELKKCKKTDFTGELKYFSFENEEENEHEQNHQLSLSQNDENEKKELYICYMPPPIMTNENRKEVQDPEPLKLFNNIESFKELRNRSISSHNTIVGPKDSNLSERVEGKKNAIHKRFQDIVKTNNCKSNTHVNVKYRIHTNINKKKNDNSIDVDAAKRDTDDNTKEGIRPLKNLNNVHLRLVTRKNSENEKHIAPNRNEKKKTCHLKQQIVIHKGKGGSTPTQNTICRLHINVKKEQLQNELKKKQFYKETLMKRSFGSEYKNDYDIGCSNSAICNGPCNANIKILGREGKQCVHANVMGKKFYYKGDSKTWKLHGEKGDDEEMEDVDTEKEESAILYVDDKYEKQKKKEAEEEGGSGGGRFVNM